MNPTRLLLASAVLAAAPLLLLELGGARIHASILTGQLPASAADGLAGLAYVLAWFSAILLAPILAIAGSLVFAATRAVSSRRTSADASPGTPTSLPSGRAG
jgi:hypothetical protein